MAMDNESKTGEASIEWSPGKELTAAPNQHAFRFYVT